MNPAALAAIGPLFQQLFGGQQVAPAAPVPQVGGPLGMGEGLGLGGNALSRLAERNNFGSGALGSGIIGGIPQATQNLPEGSSDLPAGVTGMSADKPSGFGQFFGNIDSTLSSPSKTLGIGALGEIDPRLAMAGLLASGFIRQ